MIRIPLAALTAETLAAYPHGTTLTFHETPRSRKWVQAWQIDLESTPDRHLAVWFGPRHLVGWFATDQFAPPTLAHMAAPPADFDCRPITEVRVFSPGEYNA